MAFRDYVSTVDEIRRLIKLHKVKHITKHDSSLPFNPNDWRSVYAWHQGTISETEDPHAKYRLSAEAGWYRRRRPYFNVYPTIERKLLELDDEIVLDELQVPFGCIEVRTHKITLLIAGFPSCFLCVFDFPDGSYQEVVFKKSGKIRDVLAGEFRQMADSRIFLPGTRAATVDERRAAIFMAAGVCMLAKDNSIVQPVLLNIHRKDGMTDEELRAYAEKAVQRTGRIGFDVGRDIERMPATAHYRNGCFAKYYVGKNHPSYPDRAMSERVAVIQWRVGSIVNKDRLPSVPTGFKDESGQTPDGATRDDE